MTQGLENALWRMTNRTGEQSRSYICNDDNNPLLYSRFFTVDVSNRSDILCPLYCLNHVCSILRQDITVDKIVIPLNIVDRGYYDREFRTIDSALKYVFDRNDNSLGVFQSTVKEETFYGCKNLLLDKNFDILFMPCIKLDWTNQVFKDLMIIIDYLLLYGPTSIVSKAVMKKLLPYYISKIMICEDFGMRIDKTPSVLFTNLRGINTINSTKITDAQPYDILNSEITNLVNSIDYVT
jgi:hypothetical protein